MAAATGSASLSLVGSSTAARRVGTATPKVRAMAMPTSAHLCGLINRQSSCVGGSQIVRGSPCAPRRLVAIPSLFPSTSSSSVSSVSDASLSSGIRCQSSSSAPSATKAKTIAVGDSIPNVGLQYFDEEGVMQTVMTGDLAKGKKIVLFAVPGAFTPTCSQKHLPAFVEKADELNAKGVSVIACVSVNDPFVMQAWGKNVGVSDKVMLLADGSGQFTQAMGVELDLIDRGLGVRSRRYAMLVDDGVVKICNLEEGGAFTNSGPESILEAL
ncbi:hypothetical protein CBR_g23695 [Chara braunii]|uniref:Glutaredoxin-dependent peroxiredoxin n=1 Tax=Chara braunii TaxID=69332 RepID=A0A388L593_CHABU|nr:hypothetical protein CBR_g23695 [Chara braunii]|eukprot:GBG77363.1 hypothetical protein CBR_g23695 [Chara braunii]